MNTVIRKLPPKHLDKFSVSPVADKAEFARAWQAIRFVDKELDYIGNDGELHYFQERGVAQAYCVPIQR
jgi:hypothetical protein